MNKSQVLELLKEFLSYFKKQLPNPNETLVMFFKGAVCILTLAKAYYIVSVFMHLGDEIKNMIMTIVVPLMLFVWFIGAFLWDGNYYRTQRNTYDKLLEHKHEVKKSDTTASPLK